MAHGTHVITIETVHGSHAYQHRFYGSKAKMDAIAAKLRRAFALPNTMVVTVEGRDDNQRVITFIVRPSSIASIKVVPRNSIR